MGAAATRTSAADHRRSLRKTDDLGRLNNDVNIHCMLYLRYDIFCATTMLLFVLDNNPHNWQVFCRQTDSLLEIGSNTDEWTII